MRFFNKYYKNKLEKQQVRYLHKTIDNMLWTITIVGNLIVLLVFLYLCELKSSCLAKELKEFWSYFLIIPILMVIISFFKTLIVKWIRDDEVV